MKTAKIVVIGAGSMSFGMSIFKDIFAAKELKGSLLCLVDTNKENLMKMFNLAVKLNEHTGSGLKITHTTERKEAFPGAKFIINCIAIERCSLWKYDFLVPKKYGIRHTLGENGGPGGLFFTMRTIPLILEIANDIEELCPDAYFLNFSNPESRIILALGRYKKIKCVGLCHGIFMATEDVARIMGLDAGDIEVCAAGLNHFQWLLNIREKKSGKDLYPLLRERSKSYDPDFMPLSRKLFHAFGYYPSCSDDHIGEYLPFGWEAGEGGYDFDADAQYRESLKADIDNMIAGNKQLDCLMAPSGERVVQVITGILHNKRQLIESGIIYNNGAISNLDADAAVEVPIMVDANGIHPIRIGNLPTGIAKLLNIQVGIQQMAVEAAVKGSKELALQTLLMDPVVNNTSAAESILKELWEINKPYIAKQNL
jgi:alpha-galactosidase